MMRIHTLAILVLLTSPLSSLYAADALKLDDEAARVGYSVGYQIGGDFKRQEIEMNSAAVIKGIEDALAGTVPMMSSQEMHTTLVELKGRIVAAQRVNKQEQEVKNLAEDKKYLENNGRKEGVITTKSGLQYKIISKGTGKAPVASDQVTVHYRGTLSNGQEFDSSHARGEPATFLLSNVIKGWTEGLQLIREGGKIQLVIPPSLAYNRGPLENRALLFDVELISVGEKSQSGKVDTSASPAS